MFLCNRYVQPGGGQSEYNFVIPLEGCGTGPSKMGNCRTGGCGLTIDNIIIIQSDDIVQVSVMQPKMKCVCLTILQITDLLMFAVIVIFKMATFLLSNGVILSKRTGVLQ